MVVLSHLGHVMELHLLVAYPIVTLCFHIYTCLCLPNNSTDLLYPKPPS